MHATGRRIAIVVSRFHSEIVERLLSGALSTLERHGVAPEAVVVERVPGAWEIPVVASTLAASREFDALIALGAVIRGETPHFQFIAAEAARGIAEVALRHGVPVAFGVLTCDSIEQAMERAGGAAGNKGAEAALAALETADAVDRSREHARARRRQPLPSTV